MSAPLPNAANVKMLVDRLLEKKYQGAARGVLKSINSQLKGGVMEKRAKELDAELKRLDKAGEKLAADNPVLRAYLSDLDTALKRSAGLIDGVAGDLQMGAIDAAGTLTKQLALPEFLPPEIRSRWNTPDPQAVARVVDYSQRPEFAKALGDYGKRITGQINDAAIRGIVAGKNPLAIGRELTALAENLPLYRAQSMMRTLQLTSYRDAAAINSLENADILEVQIRIAVLDKRTCMSCIALHGTPVPVGQRVNDHDQGRCTSIMIVKGRKVNIQSGETWFKAQPANVQQQIMGKAAYSAYQAGDLALSDFPKPYKDSIYGDMIREATLTEMLGVKAAKYLRGQK